MSARTARTRRIGLVIGIGIIVGAATGAAALAVSHGGRQPHSVGSAEKNLATAISANARLTEWDLPNSDRPPVPGEVCTMTYSPTGYGGTQMAIVLTQPGTLITQAAGPDGPVRDVWAGSKAGDDNGAVFDLAPEKVTALSAQLTLADDTTHDCSAEPFHNKLTLPQVTASP